MNQSCYIGKYMVTVSFPQEEDHGVIERVKQILISEFQSQRGDLRSDILAKASIRVDNGGALGSARSGAI